MSAGRRLGVGEGVAVLGAAAGTMGSAVKVDAGLGVGLATVGEILETVGAVGLTQQPAKELEIMTNSRNRADARILGPIPGRCKACLSCPFDGRDGISVILSS